MSVVQKVNPIEFEFDNQQVINAYQGPISRSFQQYTATSGTSSASIQFNITTPSRRVVVRKNIVGWYPCYISFTGTPIGPLGGPYTNFNTSTGDAPRCMPVAQNVTSLSASVGNASVQIQNSGSWIEPMTRYFLSIQERNKKMGTFPSYPDPLGAGFNTIGAVNPGTYNAFTGTAKDPFANGDQGRDHRGDYPFYLSPTNFPTNVAGQTQTAFFQSLEPFLGLSFFSQTSTSESAGFANVENMSIQVALQSPLNFWSHDITKGPAITYTSGFYAAPVVMLEYWTPADYQAPKLPLYYGFSALTQYPQNSTSAIPSGGIFTVVFNNIQMSSVANAMLLFCRVTPGEQVSSIAGENAGTIYAMDNYAGAPVVPFSSTSGPLPNIGAMQITFDNSPSQLSGMSVQQLYNMCVANGLENTSFSDWAEFGCIYKIFFGKDIFIQNEFVVAGSTGSFNMSVQAQFQNNFSRAVRFTPYLITMQDGFLKIAETNSIEVGSVSVEKLASSVVTIPQRSQAGSGLFGTIAGTVGSWVLPGYGQYAKGIGNVVDRLAGTQWKGEGGALYRPAKRARFDNYSLRQ